MNLFNYLIDNRDYRYKKSKSKELYKKIMDNLSYYEDSVKLELVNSSVFRDEELECLIENINSFEK